MKNLILSFIVLSTILFSCKKGDIGPEGAQGAKGDTGLVGPAGKDGSVMLAGTTVPAVSVGKEGDYFLNQSTDSLYGPKDVAGWGIAISVKGEKGVNGTNGTDGSQILKGKGIPDKTLGALGDFYLDTTSYLLYGPKYQISFTRIVSWGAGYQLGAPCETYVFTKPYDYISNPGLGIINIPYSLFNFTQEKANSGLSLVYLARSGGWHLANGSVGFTSIWFNARYCFYNADNSLYIYLQKADGSNWASQAAFETGIQITTIKVVVVPPGKITTIGGMANKSYDKVMEVISK